MNTNTFQTLPLSLRLRDQKKNKIGSKKNKNEIKKKINPDQKKIKSDQKKK